MEKLNYNEICRIYDDVREADIELINLFFDEVHLDRGSVVLDIGCGTGNYTALLQKITGAIIYGIDPSQGMLDVARSKNSKIIFEPGSGCEIPCPTVTFDFIYMTDVIHHIPDIDLMFFEVFRVLKPGGKMCVVTQSHRQIEKRPTSIFFPGTAVADKKRYPDIDAIHRAAANQGLRSLQVITLGENRPVQLDDDYLELVEKKGFSMFHLIDDDEYHRGLTDLREAMTKGPVCAKTAGASLVWLGHP